MKRAYSVNGISIRLTYERWYHIVENHDDLAGYLYEVLEVIEKPDFVVKGNKGVLKATKGMGRNRWMVVFYREVSRTDGFIITAYFLDKRPKGETIWRRG